MKPTTVRVCLGCGQHYPPADHACPSCGSHAGDVQAEPTREPVRRAAHATTPKPKPTRGRNEAVTRR